MHSRGSSTLADSRILELGRPNHDLGCPGDDLGCPGDDLGCPGDGWDVPIHPGDIPTTFPPPITPHLHSSQPLCRAKRHRIDHMNHSTSCYIYLEGYEHAFKMKDRLHVGCLTLKQGMIKFLRSYLGIARSSMLS